MSGKINVIALLYRRLCTPREPSPLRVHHHRRQCEQKSHMQLSMFNKVLNQCDFAQHVQPWRLTPQSGDSMAPINHTLVPPPTQHGRITKSATTTTTSDIKRQQHASRFGSCRVVGLENDCCRKVCAHLEMDSPRQNEFNCSTARNRSPVLSHKTCLHQQ